MEDTHWERSGRRSQNLLRVLILVLMEDTHWVQNYRRKFRCLLLNPCYNGSYSMRLWIMTNEVAALSLNPCFNGRYSLRVNAQFLLLQVTDVLILVLMEDTHWGFSAVQRGCGWIRLNPCFNGRYSLSAAFDILSHFEEVLILVLMEDTHWVILTS